MTRSELLEEVVACHRLGCGLEVCVYPKPGFAKKYALLATRYGSNDTRFRVNGEEAMTPAGIAHFLEHKLFEAEDGSIDDVFARQGAYSTLPYLNNAASSPGNITSMHRRMAHACLSSMRLSISRLRFSFSWAT